MTVTVGSILVQVGADLEAFNEGMERACAQMQAFGTLATKLPPYLRRRP